MWNIRTGGKMANNILFLKIEASPAVTVKNVAPAKNRRHFYAVKI